MAAICRPPPTKKPQNKPFPVWGFRIIWLWDIDLLVYMVRRRGFKIQVVWPRYIDPQQNIFSVGIQNTMVARHWLIGIHGLGEGVQNIMAAIYRPPKNTFWDYGFIIPWSWDIDLLVSMVRIMGFKILWLRYIETHLPTPQNQQHILKVAIQNSMVVRHWPSVGPMHLKDAEDISYITVKFD
jgi:hypothetical protein